MKRKLNLLLCIILLLPLDLSAQDKQVKGKVVEAETGESLPGVSILVENSTRGVTTDVDGTFEIRVLPSDKLIFSFIGMESQIIEVKNQTYLEVAMHPTASELEEVTVVGFGTQKTKDLVGAVTSVQPDELRIASSDLTMALAGRISGMIAYQRSGEPGKNNVDFFVRGVTTFGYKNSPLILIDGIESTSNDLSRLTTDDIQSFNILKDATSTAVYGARGANGVILINTKRGREGKAKISLRVENNLSTPTKDVELADPVTYMKMANEAIMTRDPLGTVLYSEDKINNTLKAGSNSYIYPANDWRKILFKDYTNNQKYTLNVSGGGGVARYFISGAVTHDNGILKVDKINNFNNNINYKTYSLRSNVDIDLSSSTLLTVRLFGNFEDYRGPLKDGDEMYSLVMHSNPVQFPAIYPKDKDHEFVNHIMFGNYYREGQGAYINPYAEMVKGYRDWNRSRMTAQFEMRQDFSKWVKGLTVRAMANIDRRAYMSVSRQYTPFYYGIQTYDSYTNEYKINMINGSNSQSGWDTGTEYLSDPGNAYKEISSNFYFESVLTYDNILSDVHSLNAMLVYMLSERIESNKNTTTLQSSLPFRNLGVSGRFAYTYDNRYHTEFNFGYNGSERFYKDQRFGFFPSAGIAWSLHNESFFAPLKNTINKFKIKYTYGLIGNDEIGNPYDRFFYLSQVDMNNASRRAQFGRGDVNYGLNGVLVNRYANSEITWEKSLQQNLGFEWEFLDAFQINLDFFKQKRTNILMDRSFIPETMGLSAAVRANVGEASSQGVDLSLNFDKQVTKDFWLSAMGNYTFARSRFDIYEEPAYKETYRSRIGYPINQQFGYIAERLFVDDEEALNAPNQGFNSNVMGGDIKYLDVNRDGKITAADQVPIGFPTVPEITYGFGISAGYKNMDFSVFFQGLANESFWINYAGYDTNGRYIGISPFVHETQVMKVISDSYWSEQNQDIYAFWPRLSNTINNNNAQTNTWFMRNGSFLRLKTIEIGYNLPKNILNKIGASGLRIYVSGNNLLTFSKFNLWDVEMGGNGLGYPIQKVFNVGLNLNFN
ncbi:MAG TPA: SusC/RagA family TonB-linked outer membrane protein [Porphyromonadaceae bacterium]|jgi:TonB-linked SusC/RagA family outer membrane protein|nr:SusC/RagA family TonB-linked outer membrane protein [Porphyromonadaceae bacterium]HBL33787.1 SusC/RagA family TonB-linked outer membrane protein [Porphyromonadaceae bacterium]HBX20005.1 SusC/RagA family TonB-linked outer membrane protein [Porphyromonadaceae bacterium]